MHERNDRGGEGRFPDSWDLGSLNLRGEVIN
jgi:hypothetical protein